MRYIRNNSTMLKPKFPNKANKAEYAFTFFATHLTFVTVQ